MKKIIYFIAIGIILSIASFAQTPQEVGSYKGCTMFRQARSGDRDINIGLGSKTIQVIYNQWLITPSGDKVEEVIGRCYFVKNVPAVLDSVGQVVTPAFNGYDNWKNYNAGGTPDGTTLETIILGAVNNTLKNTIPIDAVDGYVIPQ